MLGNVRAVTDGAGHTTKISYTDNWNSGGGAPPAATYALPTKTKQGQSTDVTWSGAKYNYYIGTMAESYHLAGTSGTGTQENTTSYTYDTFGHVATRVRPDGGQTSYAYWDNWMANAIYTAIDTSKTRYDFMAYDGAGQTRYTGSDHPDGASGKYTIRALRYDNVGRTVKSANPIETDGSLPPDRR